jgi:photosystem II stability/assembly factor-like uncharacterized protein
LKLTRLLIPVLVVGCALLTVAQEGQQERRGRKAQSGTAQASEQKQPNPPQPTPPQALINANLFKDMKWRQIGPYRGGRVLAVTGIPDNPNVFYFGAVAGGVFRTMDGGNSWEPLMQREAISSVGAIAIADSNPNIIYVGSGEACLRGNISHGDGVYKSLDAGKTWKNIGLRDSRHIGALIVDPHDPNRVFVAAVGHAYGPNAERGIFRSLDGGNTWQKVLFKDDQTGGIDVVFDPHNSNTLFAAMYQVIRRPWELISGGPGSGLYKSTDGGTTWKRLEGNGLPEGILGRIGVSVSGADSNRVYALIEAKDGGLFRSDDGGEHWTRVNDDLRLHQRSWYFMHVFADPKNADTVYVLNTGMFRSNDGGKSVTLLPAPHGDHHGLWIDPTHPERMINGNDGGATITVDGGKSWTTQYNQPTAQFYHVATDNRFPYYLYGAQQDNSTIAIASYSDQGVITMRDWYEVGGGESGYIAPDPHDANVVYAGGNAGFITRFDKRTEQAQDISVVPLDSSGHGVGDFPHRFQWTEPIVVSVHDPNVIYTAGEAVFRSADQGMSWTQISPDLTRNDKSKQQASGGPISKDNTSVEYYDTVFTLAESTLEKNLLWAGSDDGLVHVTRDGGKSWQNVTPKAVPEWSMISLLEACPHDAGSAFMAVDRHRLDDLRPYIFKTHDYGKTWTEIVNGIPDGSFVHAVREDTVRKGLLYAGTETGVFVSIDDGGHWQSLQLNLPTTPINDLVVKDNNLNVATNGRSFWILDDLSPLRQVQPQMVNDDVVLYRPELALRLHYPEGVAKRRPVGENPPSGAIINYYLKNTHKDDEVTLDIFDTQGKLVRHLSSKEKKEGAQPPEWPDLEPPKETIPANAGMNRYAWDLRYDKPTPVPGAFYTGNGPVGPLAMPATYQLRLTVNGKSYTEPLELKLDPRVHASAEALQKQFALALRVRDDIDRLHQAINQIRDVRAQLKTLDKRFGESAQLKPVATAAQDLEKKLAPVELQLIQVNMKSSESNLNFPSMLNEQYDILRQSVELADAAPTQQQYAVADQLEKRLDEQLAAWHGIVSQDVVALNNMIRNQNVPVIYIPPITAPAPPHVAAR